MNKNYINPCTIAQTISTGCQLMVGSPVVDPLHDVTFSEIDFENPKPVYGGD